MTKCIQCKGLVGLSVFHGTLSTNKIYRENNINEKSAQRDANTARWL